MPSPLYYNDSSKRTLYDVAREISILTGKIRMMNPNLYETEGITLVKEMHNVLTDFLMRDLRKALEPQKDLDESINILYNNPGRL